MHAQCLQQLNQTIKLSSNKQHALVAQDDSQLAFQAWLAEKLPEHSVRDSSQAIATSHHPRVIEHSPMPPRRPRSIVASAPFSQGNTAEDRSRCNEDGSHYGEEGVDVEFSALVDECKELHRKLNDGQNHRHGLKQNRIDIRRRA